MYPQEGKKEVIRLSPDQFKKTIEGTVEQAEAVLEKYDSKTEHD
jgi:hypothetical protein